ncbi:MAG TPA: RNA polymerase factor sigma-54 [Hyphomicrobiaceae bacterium]|nr:RNA polymerase factor sigma-54 [Hyphomicrobiaceae bacterium]
MVLTPKLELRQGQQLVMTPQLQQAIRLLQLSNLDLGVFVESELERNPLLERDEALREHAETQHKQRLKPNSEEAKPAGRDDPQPPARGDGPANGGGMGGEMGGGWASLRPSTHNGDGGDGPNLEEFVAAARSLADHLTEQLHLMITDPAERLIGAHLIHMVDESGYLLGSLDDEALRLGAPQSLVAKVLATLQGFDPPGVFARDLAECLALQLKDANRYDPQIARLLDNLALLGSHNLAALRRAVGVDNDELVEMVAEIKRLNPKPGLKFGSIQIQPILPDVLVRPGPDGSWIVELNSETLPRVLVNQRYYTSVATTARSEQDKGYLLDCLQSANWLVKSLDQRARTILRVAEEIVRQQDGFLEHGVEHLKPLNLRNVADAISMHESTVSRVTSNKYMSTPRGIFELKYFFTSAIQSANGGSESHSSEAVRHRIRQLVDAETPQTVLSDDKLVEYLKKDGIDIARRTVAKYREALRIPSSVQRRRQKQMAARLRQD